MSSARQSGFTLLEMCLVLFIIALLGGAMMPGMKSAFVEQGLRKDAHQLSLMVKTAMLRSAEQKRVYVIDLTASSMSLHSLADATPTAANPAIASDSAPSLEATEFSQQLDSSNKLLAPDPKKLHAWVDMPDTTWTFTPGELCPAQRVRLTRGDAWIEMSFNALTGNVEDEEAYIP